MFLYTVSKKEVKKLPLVGLSTSYFGFKKIPIYDSVKRASELGFETIELGAGHFFEKNISQTIKKIKKDFPKKNFTVHGLFPPLKKRYWFNASLGLTPINKKILKSMFKTAELMGALCVTVHPGFLADVSFGQDINGMDYGVPGKLIPKEKAVKNVFSVAKFSLALAKKTNVKFGIENIPLVSYGYPIYSLQDFSNFFSELPEAGFLLDIGHALSEQRLEELLSLKEKIIQMHVHYSRPKSGTVLRDEHKPIISEEQIFFMKQIPQIKKIPLIFEHGNNISEEEILKEKELLENFLRKI